MRRRTTGLTLESVTSTMQSRLRRVRPAPIDVLLAVALAIGSALNLTYMAREVEQEGFTDPDIWAYGLVLAQTLPVMWRRTAPVGLLTISSAGFVVARLLDYPVGVELIGLGQKGHPVLDVVQPPRPDVGINLPRAPKVAIKVTMEVPP